MSFVLELATVLWPVVLGGGVTYAMSGIKKVSTTVDGLAPLPQRAIVVTLAFLSTKLSTALGTPLPEDLLHIDPTTLATVLAAAAAFVWHKLRKVYDAWKAKRGK